MDDRLDNPIWHALITERRAREGTGEMHLTEEYDDAGVSGTGG